MVEIIKNKISDRQNIFRFLIWGIVFSFGLYLYFLSHTIYSVVERQRSEQTIATLQGSIEKLEAVYSNLKAHVTVSLAEAKGFTSVTSATYISRKPIGKALSLNNEI